MSTSKKLAAKAAGARILVDAKIQEYGAFVQLENRPAADQARTQALAALESYFDHIDATHEALRAEEA